MTMIPEVYIQIFNLDTIL